MASKTYDVYVNSDQVKPEWWPYYVSGSITVGDTASSNQVSVSITANMYLSEKGKSWGFVTLSSYNICYS